MEPVIVIIPVFNRPEYTKVCLDALYSTRHGTAISPIVVNNGSRQKTTKVILDWLQRYEGLSEEIKSVVDVPTIITLESNKGFSTAVNSALRSISNLSDKYVVILHNDTVVFPGWLGKMLPAFEEDDDVAVVSPRTSYANEMSPCDSDLRKEFELVKPPNKDRITPEEIETMISGLYGTDREAFASAYADKAQIEFSYSPEISSFCMLTKGAFFSEYGLFDEDFWPRGYEDKFWWRPLERNGMITMISNKAFVWHAGNITSDGPSFSQPQSMLINKEKYDSKCMEIDKNRGELPKT